MLFCDVIKVYNSGLRVARLVPKQSCRVFVILKKLRFKVVSLVQGIRIVYWLIKLLKNVTNEGSVYIKRKI